MIENPNPDRLSDRSSEPASGTPVDALARACEDLLNQTPSYSPLAASSITSGTSVPCPAPDKWLQFAVELSGISGVSGEPQHEDHSALLAHAATCHSCAALLRQSQRLLEDEPSPEEEAELGGLRSASPFWQHQMAVELAHSPRQSSLRKSRGWYLWASAGLAASLALAVGLTLWWQHINTPERLLAESYTHSRIFEMRMPGADFAGVTPETHLRGGASRHESSWLLEARARIERHLESTPQDPHWLQLEARADVLEEKFDPAIDILDRLLAAGPVTASLLTDDAAAYFQRGTATGSENDRATALDYLRRADELAPSDTLVLFNEAVVMEDRGQVMNAVETWNRYLRFERDPLWQAEGRRRLQSLEQKLNQLKTHQSRMDQHFANPQAMLTLAADQVALAAIDEELSNTQLPKLLDSAFPMPVDRSRGSPCPQTATDKCQAARQLLHALAASLERNHQDSWLSQFLPPPNVTPSDEFTQAAHALSHAIGGDASGDYAGGQKWAIKARQFFHSLGNAAGEDRATVEQAYALQLLSDIPGCYRAAHSLLGHDPQFAWIQIHDLTQDSACDPAPGTGSEDNPTFLRVVSKAQERHYTLLQLRARNWLGAAAVDTGDVENTWKIYLGTLHRFYSGDYPPMRLYATMSGLEEVEESTPRVHNALLLQREAIGALEMSQNVALIPAERLHLAAVAIRAGSVAEAQEQMRVAQDELEASGGGNSVHGFLVENEDAMASLYLDRKDLANAAKMLDAAQGHIAGENNSFHRREYALARGRLELALGHSDTAESLLREAILEEERLASKGGVENITLAQQDRDLYAVLAGVWLAEGRSGEDALALWERYRLRILGKLTPPCPSKDLACLQPKLTNAFRQLGEDQLLGQVVLFDRVLLYRVTSSGVAWTSVPIGREDLLATVEPLERAASSPATSQASVDQAAWRVGRMLFRDLRKTLAATGQLLIEPDPLLGNVPWPAVETADGPIGLQFDLAESPSLLLAPQQNVSSSGAIRPPKGTNAASPLVVGASFAFGESNSLPEVLNEAKAVARFGQNSNLLLGSQATEAQVTAHLETASAIHFAGHASKEDGATRLLLAPALGIPSATIPGKPYLDSAVLRRHPPRAARLAVFSACSTGKREEGWNHGMGDIVDSLAALGVPEVVATRWQIDSSSAVLMMEAFYGGLARGLTVSHALTMARQSLVRDARYRHPYYWAAYYASGTGKSNLSQIFQPAR